MQQVETVLVQLGHGVGVYVAVIEQERFPVGALDLEPNLLVEPDSAGVVA